MKNIKTLFVSMCILAVIDISLSLTCFVFKNTMLIEFLIIPIVLKALTRFALLVVAFLYVKRKKDNSDDAIDKTVISKAAESFEKADVDADKWMVDQ